MKTDRELLELAAKAAGLINPRYHFNLGRDYEAPTGILHDFDGGRTTHSWNPLTDDGDALRLAVKLDMIDERQWKAPVTGAIYDECFGDWYASTRLAIVRVAAEIGEQMP